MRCSSLLGMLVTLGAVACSSPSETPLGGTGGSSGANGGSSNSGNGGSTTNNGNGGSTSTASGGATSTQNGGATSTQNGGSSNGGSSNGGSTNGGSTSGGSSNGGSSNGGSTNGGSSNGGSTNGGSSNGGSSNGGSTNGGSSNGGATTASGGATTASGGATTASGGSSSGGRASGGATSGGASSGGAASGGATGTGGSTSTTTKFSFFVTSVGAMRKYSNNTNGFGGELHLPSSSLRGLAGADEICTTIAEASLAGSGAKGWKAFLSTVAGPVNAIDRLGAGPWYDRLGRTVALVKADLLHDRPSSADAAIINDLPNENGIPNHTDGAPGCTGNACPDNHDTLTGTGPDGKLHSTNTGSTCNDWTSSAASGAPWCGHSWPRNGSGVNWMSALAEGGCAPGVNLVEMGPPNAANVGSGGGYGGIYCFANSP
ncbi:MAG: hypothetical protein QM756_28045 [Polyangiaceae bacterium]